MLSFFAVLIFFLFCFAYGFAMINLAFIWEAEDRAYVQVRTGWKGW